MLSEPASVAALSDDAVHLQTRRGATCSGCSLKSGCGQYLLASKDESLVLPRSDFTCAADAAALQPGAQVRLSMAPSQLLRLSFLFYLLPLALLLLGTLAGLWLGSGESSAILGAAAGLLTGLLLARRALRRQSRTVSLTLQEAARGSEDSL